MICGPKDDCFQKNKQSHNNDEDEPSSVFLTLNKQLPNYLSRPSIHQGITLIKSYSFQNQGQKNDAF